MDNVIYIMITEKQYELMMQLLNDINEKVSEGYTGRNTNVIKKPVKRVGIKEEIRIHFRRKWGIRNNYG